MKSPATAILCMKKMDDWIKLIDTLERTRLLPKGLERMTGGEVWKAIREAYGPEGYWDNPFFADKQKNGLFLASPLTALWFASEIMDGTNDLDSFPEYKKFVKKIGSTGETAYQWADEYHRGTGRRWNAGSTARRLIGQLDPPRVLEYSLHILDESFPEGEEALINAADRQYVERYDRQWGMFGDTPLSDKWDKAHDGPKQNTGITEPTNWDRW